MMADEIELTELPSMIRTGDGYRVVNPSVLADGFNLLENGHFLHRNDGLYGGITAVLFVAPTVALPVFLATGGAWWVVLWVLAGAAVGVLLAGISAVVLPTDAFERHRKRTSEEAELIVTHGHPQARRICALGDRIAKSAAWRTGAFDADGRLLRVIFGSVRRALRLAASKAEYSDDKRLGLDTRAHAEARRAITEAEQVLTELEDRLRAIKDATDVVEFKIDPARRPPRRPRSGDWADPLQEAELLRLEITTMRDYL
jgi:hypothetical protein